MGKEITILDLFSGIGGFSKGLKDAGLNIAKHYYSEINKHAIACYVHNFKNSEYAGTVENVRGIERPDIITFGSPCQDFSLAGKRRGMDGERSSLIREAIKLVAKFKPDVFIWENVKGTFSSNAGTDFWAIIKAFADIGDYRLEWQLLNTAWFLPQNRERIYLIGHLAGRSEPGVFPIKENDTRANKGVAEATTIRAITAGGHSGGHHSGMTLIKQLNESKESGGVQPYQQNRVYDTDGIVPSVLADMSSGTHAIAVQKTRGDCTTIQEGKTGCLPGGGSNVMDKVPNVVQVGEIIGRMRALGGGITIIHRPFRQGRELMEVGKQYLKMPKA